MSVTTDDELAKGCLDAAAKAGYPDVVRGFIGLGVKPDNASLAHAIDSGDAETFRVIREAIRLSRSGVGPKPGG